MHSQFGEWYANVLVIAGHCCLYRVSCQARIPVHLKNPCTLKFSLPALRQRIICQKESSTCPKTSLPCYETQLRGWRNTSMRAASAVPSSGSAAWGHATNGGNDTIHPGGLLRCCAPAAGCLLLSKPAGRSCHDSWMASAKLPEIVLLVVRITPLSGTCTPQDSPLKTQTALLMKGFPTHEPSKMIHIVAW